MVITIESSIVPNFNYAYIEDFNRYYFIEDIVSLRNNLWELTMSIDVLMTYRLGILNLRGFIDRSQSLYNDRLIDKKRIIEQGYDIENVEIPNEVFVNPHENESQLDIMVVVNGYKIDSVSSI